MNYGMSGMDIVNVGIRGLFESLRRRIVLRRLRNMFLRRRCASYGDGRMMCLNIHTRKRRDSVLRVI